MSRRKPTDVCPVEYAGSLDNRLRRMVHNPVKLLKPFIEPGMTVLDMGCGPGFFTLDMARLAGPEGRVVAVDLQQGMLDKVRDKIVGTDLEARIDLLLCPQDHVGGFGPVDFALLFYMVHEVPDPRRFFTDMAAVMKPGGRVLMVEPPFHTTKEGIRRTLDSARAAGFAVVQPPRGILDTTVVLQKEV